MAPPLRLIPWLCKRDYLDFLYGLFRSIELCIKIALTKRDASMSLIIALVLIALSSIFKSTSGSPVNVREKALRGSLDVALDSFMSGPIPHLAQSEAWREALAQMSHVTRTLRAALEAANGGNRGGGSSASSGAVRGAQLLEMSHPPALRIVDACMRAVQALSSSGTPPASSASSSSKGLSIEAIRGLLGEVQAGVQELTRLHPPPGSSFPIVRCVRVRGESRDVRKPIQT